jgi:hypothetical protein
LKTGISWLENELKTEAYFSEQAEAITEFLTNKITDINVDAFIALIKKQKDDNLYSYQFYRDIIEKLS